MGAAEARAQKCQAWLKADYIDHYRQMSADCGGHDSHGRPIPPVNDDMSLTEVFALWDKLYENEVLRRMGCKPMPSSASATETEPAKDEEAPITVEMDRCHLTLPCQHFVNIGKERRLMSAPDIRALLAKNGMPIDAHFTAAN